MLRTPLTGDALLQKIATSGDSDRVTEAGPTRAKTHKIDDAHNNDGICYLHCPVTHKRYKHEIQVPNKNELLCRGCGADI